VVHVFVGIRKLVSIRLFETIRMLIHWNEKQQSQWDEAISQSADGGFLQSWEWGQFQESLGNKVFRVSDQSMEWFSQGILLRAGREWIMYLPRGPVYIGKEEPKKGQLTSFLSAVKGLAKEKGCFLLRFDAPWDSTGEESALLEHLPVQKVVRERQPVHTLILSTKKEEDELLEEMKSKHRYNIRLAEKKGVRVRVAETDEEKQQGIKLLKETSSRQNFSSYDQAYYQSMLDHLPSLKMFIAEYEGGVIAVLLAAFFSDRALYLHGGSDYTHRKVMAPFLLQWKTIQEAKKQGMDYDFWGVAADPPANKQEQGWSGITRFKKGFTPTTIITEYVGTYELSVKKLTYFLYQLRAKLK